MTGNFVRLASRLRTTPLHPQWFAFLREHKNLKHTCSDLSGIVLDVGCAERRPRAFLSEEATYIGLDHYSTATDWYATKPDLYGDAQSLPIADGVIDHALLLDVLEHIPDPDRCIRELHRVLKSGGSLTIQVPFMYPIHDAPLDFCRWTRYGLERTADQHGYAVSSERALGHPLETAALNANIAMSKTIINWLRGRNPLAALGLLLPILVPVINLWAWLFAALSRGDELMPYAYRATWIKT